MSKLNSDVLREIIEAGGVDYKENSSSFLFNCPRCNKRLKLAMHKTKGFWCCYRCKSEGFKGRPEYALQELYSIPAEEFRRKLYGEEAIQLKKYLHLNLQDPWDSEISPESTSLSEVQWDPDFLDPDDLGFRPCAEYLKSRLIPEERIKEYGIKYNPKWGTVVFPVLDGDKLYGWQERSIRKGNDFRYTLKGFQRENFVMFYDRLLSSSHAIITEGPVDALKMHLAGGNISTMGKVVTTAQIELIKNMGFNKIYLGLDRDASQEFNKISRELLGYCELYSIQPPSHRKDLGECTEEEGLQAFNNAERYNGKKIFYLRNFYERY